LTDENKILEGSFKEIPIRIRSASITGGRKFVKKEFPNRDTQTIEDLGLKPRTYDLDIIISDVGKTAANAEPSEDYFEYRDRLIAAIEDKGPGTLIHPLHGRIENVIATTYSTNETLTDFGLSTLFVTFETSSNTGIPVQSITALSQIEQSRGSVDVAVTQDISANFSVDPKLTNNFIDAQNKVNQIIQSAIDATSFIGAAADEINEFNSFIGQFSANVNSLIIAPNDLSLSISNLFNNINGLFGTIENTAKSFINLFAFGDNDEDNIITTTAQLIERKNNRAILNQAINAQALSYAYVSVAQVSFETVAEIEEAEQELEVQYRFIVDNSDSNPDINSTLTDMRVVVQTFFDEQRLSAKQVISIFTNITSARLLSFQYYAESESAEDIIALNGITDVSFVEGDVDILTA